MRALAVSGDILLAGADSSGSFTALDVRTGRLLWRHRVPTSIHNDPVIQDSIVVVSFGDLWREPSVGGAWAYELRSGRPLWKYDISQAIMPSPVLIGETVVLAGGDECIHGVGLRDGKRRYRICLAMWAAMSNPKRMGTSVFMGTTDGHVVSFDGVTGMIRWIRQLPLLSHAGDATIAVGDKALFITGTSWTGAVSYTRDTTFWSGLRASIGAFFSDRFDQHTMYFSRQRAVRLDPDSGTIVWNTSIGLGRRVLRNQSGTPALFEHLVIVSSPVGLSLSALDAGSGRIVWTRRLPARHRGVPTILGDTVFVGLESGVLMAFGAHDGEPRGECRWPGRFTASAPLIVGRTLIYGATDGTLHAVPVSEVSERMRARGACF